MSVYRTVTVKARIHNDAVKAYSNFSDNLIREKSVRTNIIHRNVVGEKNYELLDNKPSIEEVVLIGNKSFLDFGLRPATKLEIEEILQS